MRAALLLCLSLGWWPVCSAETMTDQEKILESLRTGPASDAAEDRAAWRSATEPDARLLWAALHGDALECTSALSGGANADAEAAVEPGDVDATVGQTRTPLKLAAMRADHEMLDELLSAGADVNLANGGADRTALMMAVESQQWTDSSPELTMACLTALLKAGADIEQQSSDGMTALALAAAIPEGVAVVRALLEEHDGAALEDPMPLILAAHHGNAESSRALLSRGANPDRQAGANGGALLMAASYGKHDVVTALLDFGADPDLKNTAGRFPLKQAVLQNHLNCAKELVDAGAHVSSRAIKKSTITLSFLRLVACDSRWTRTHCAASRRGSPEATARRTSSKYGN